MQAQTQYLMRKGIHKGANASYQVLGPYTREQVEVMLRQGAFSITDELCEENQYWFAVGDHEELHRHFQMDDIVFKKPDGDKETTENEITRTEEITRTSEMTNPSMVYRRPSANARPAAAPKPTLPRVPAPVLNIRAQGVNQSRIPETSLLLKVLFYGGIAVAAWAVLRLLGVLRGGS